MRLAAVLATALAGGFVTGCSWAGEVQELPDGTQVLVSGPSDSGEDARLAGRVEVVDGCLGVAGVVVVWTHGTEAVEGEAVVTLADGERVGLGDEVVLGGGSHAWDELPGALPRVPEGCRGAEVFVESEPR